MKGLRGYSEVITLEEKCFKKRVYRMGLKCVFSRENILF